MTFQDYLKLQPNDSSLDQSKMSEEELAKKLKEEYYKQLLQGSLIRPKYRPGTAGVRG